ncbi:hypothetical protein GCM10028802_18960 [Terrabacter terrigena]
MAPTLSTGVVRPARPHGPEDRGFYPDQSDTGEVRTDLEPVPRRFSALGRPVSETWMSGTLGGDAPGPRRTGSTPSWR